LFIGPRSLKREERFPLIKGYVGPPSQGKGEKGNRTEIETVLFTLLGNLQRKKRMNFLYLSTTTHGEGGKVVFFPTFIEGATTAKLHASSFRKGREITNTEGKEKDG